MPPTQLGKGIAQGCCSPLLKALDTLIPASQTQAAYRLGVVTDPCGAVPWWGPRQGTPCSRAHRPHPLRARTCANHGTHEHVNKYVYSHTHHCLSHGSHVHLYVCVCLCVLGHSSTSARSMCTCIPGHEHPHVHFMCLCVCICGHMHIHTRTGMGASVAPSAGAFVCLWQCEHIGVHVPGTCARVYVNTSVHTRMLAWACCLCAARVLGSRACFSGKLTLPQHAAQPPSPPRDPSPSQGSPESDSSGLTELSRSFSFS